MPDFLNLIMYTDVVQNLEKLGLLPKGCRMFKFESVGVVGAGQMGNGIAQVAAMNGLPVVMTDVSQEALDKGKATIEKSLDRLLKKRKDLRVRQVCGPRKDCDFCRNHRSERLRYCH
jgi:alanine dehydrogenase